jgi:hypothetical protein
MHPRVGRAAGRMVRRSDSRPNGMVLSKVNDVDSDIVCSALASPAVCLSYADQLASYDCQGPVEGAAGFDAEADHDDHYGILTPYYERERYLLASPPQLILDYEVESPEAKGLGCEP